MLLGHLAVPTILREFLALKAAPLYLGSVAPDLCDKGLKAAGLAPSGRTIAHTLLSLGLTTAVVERLWGRAAAQSWGLGYLGHLLADLNGFLPWWFPFSRYTFPRNRRSFWQSLWRTLSSPGRLEVFLVIWAAWLALRGPLAACRYSRSSRMSSSS